MSGEEGFRIDKELKRLRAIIREMEDRGIESMSQFGFIEAVRGHLRLSARQCSLYEREMIKFRRELERWEQVRDSLFFQWIESLPSALAIFYLKNAYKWTDKNEHLVKQEDYKSVLARIMNDEPSDTEQTGPTLVEQNT